MGRTPKRADPLATDGPADAELVPITATMSLRLMHDAFVAGALECNQRLLEQLDAAEVAMLLAHRRADPQGRSDAGG